MESPLSSPDHLMTGGSVGGDAAPSEVSMNDGVSMSEKLRRINFMYHGFISPEINGPDTTATNGTAAPTVATTTVAAADPTNGGTIPLHHITAPANVPQSSHHIDYGGTAMYPAYMSDYNAAPQAPHHHTHNPYDPQPPTQNAVHQMSMSYRVPSHPHTNANPTTVTPLPHIIHNTPPLPEGSSHAAVTNHIRNSHLHASTLATDKLPKNKNSLPSPAISLTPVSSNGDEDSSDDSYSNPQTTTAAATAAALSSLKYASGQRIVTERTLNTNYDWELSNNYTIYIWEEQPLPDNVKEINAGLFWMDDVWQDEEKFKN